MSLLRRAGAIVVLGGLGGLFAPACVKDESSLYVKGCVVQSLDTCEATADPSAAERFEGLLDTSVAPEYSCPLLIGNQLVARGDPSTLKTETSRIELYAADVTILDAPAPYGNQITRADGSAAAYTVPVSGEIDPGTGTLPGFGLSDVLMLDAATALDLGAQAQSSTFQQTVVANVVMRGRTLGGDDIESAAFQFPIQVCNGCLCDSPPGIDCCDSTDMPDPNCRLGSDEPVDCRFLGESCACLHGTGPCPC